MDREKAEEMFLRRFNVIISAAESERKKYTPTCVKNHSRRVAEAAAEIASKCGMDTDEVYIAGLLHDIGKTSPEWEGGLNHACIGYKMLMGEGFETAARVAMTHTFYGYKDIPRDDFWAEMAMEDVATVQQYMDSHEMTDLDLLIQLVDNMVHDVYVMTVSDRFCDILIRHKLQDADLHIKTLFKLKQYFDKKCGMNIYELFRDDIIKTALEEPNMEYSTREEIKDEI